MFTGWVIPIPVPDKTAETTAKVIMEHVIPSHAVPLRILTDRGGEFRNKIIEELCEKMQIGHIQTSPFSPQANGRCERTHRAMTACLSKMCGKSQADWDTCLPAFSSAYNTSKSSATGFSAFYLLYGRDPVLPVDTLLKPRRKYLGEDYFPQALERLHIAYRVVRKHLHKQSNRNKRQKEPGRVPDNFQIGDAVYLKNNQRTNKLQKRWLSHYRIIAQRGPVSFTLKNQLTGKIREAHAKDIRKASEGELWAVADEETKNPRQSTLALPETDSESGESSTDSNASVRDSDEETIIYEYGDGPILSSEGPGPAPGQGSVQEVTPPDNTLDTPTIDHSKGDILPSATPDQSGQVSDSSEWSDEDNIPLDQLRKDTLNKRKTREAKTKANDKLKRLKELLCLVSELA
jgi:transposase InsO family protein